MPPDSLWSDAFLNTRGVFVVHTAGPVPGLAESAERIIHRINPEVPILQATPLADVVMSTLAARRFITMLLALFAALTTIMAGAGLFGVMSFVVAERTREFGVRIAMGARPSQVVWLVVKRASRVIASGVVLGLAGSLVVRGITKRFLYGIVPNDPQALLAACLLLALVGYVAAFLPAFRATRIEPRDALMGD